MKLFLMFALAVSSLFLQAPVAEAQSHSMRYKSSYRHWNTGFRTYYGYRETECVTDRVSYGTIETCYDLGPTDAVYVWERRNGHYRQITVYRDRYYSDSIADYYVYDNGSIHTVRARRWHSHPRYHNSSYCWDRSPYDSYWACSNTTVIVHVDFATAEGKIITGAQAILVGADIAANSKSDVGVAIGAGIAISGSISAAKGFEQLHRESALAKAVSQAKVEAEGTNSDIK